jgi:hypothetical protein
LPAFSEQHQQALKSLKLQEERNEHQQINASTEPMQESHEPLATYATDNIQYES